MGLQDVYSIVIVSTSLFVGSPIVVAGGGRRDVSITAMSLGFREGTNTFSTQARMAAECALHDPSGFPTPPDLVSCFRSSSAYCRADGRSLRSVLFSTPSCPDLFRASSRVGLGLGALVDGRDKPGHDVMW